MSADLDTLNDAQLSEVFAVEYLGWAKSNHSESWWHHGVLMSKRGVKFATSADAVLPFLPVSHVGIHRAQNGSWSVGVGYSRGGLHYDQNAVAPTLPRAICIALILAKRAENGGAK